jgi:hypothetical protein
MVRFWTLLCLILALILGAGGCKPERPDADDDDSWDDDDDDDDDTIDIPELTLAIESPADGMIGLEETVLVSGTVTGDHPVVTVNGNAAEVDGETFAVEIPLHSGDPYTAILAEAVDSHGWIRDRRTYLHGVPTDASLPVDEGLAVRLTDRGLEGIESFVLTTFTADAIATMLLSSNPLYDDSWVGTQIVVTADDATIGGLALEMDALVDGIRIDAALQDVVMDVTVDADWAGTYPGTVRVDAVNLQGLATLSAAGGSLVVDLPDLTVELVNLTTDFPGIWDWIEDLVLWLIPGFLEDAIASMLQQEVVGAVEQALGTLEDGFPLGPVTVGLAFDSVAHDPDGIAAVLDLSLSLGPGGGDVPEMRVSTEGSLPPLLGTTSPLGTEYGAWVVLDDDALSAIGIALMGSGLLHQHIEGELPMDTPLPLTAGLLMPMFPSLEGVLDDDALLTIDTAPSVSPVGRPAHGPEGVLEFVLPGFMVDIAGDVDGDGAADPIYRIVIDGVLEVSIDTDGDTLSVKGADMSATLLSAEVDAARNEGEELATLLQLAIGLMVGDLVDQLLTLIDGMTLVPMEGGACGPAGDHASFFADLLPTS